MNSAVPTACRSQHPVLGPTCSAETRGDPPTVGKAAFGKAGGARLRPVLSLLACVAIQLPAHAAPLAFSQSPPASVRPPPPNIIATLDDSGSMNSLVAFSTTETYPVPPGPDGNPIATMPAAPKTFSDGYVENPAAIDLPTAEANTYNALPAAQKDPYRRWYAFYRTRLFAMRAAVMKTFTSTNVPDGSVRLAWQGLIGSCHTGFPAETPANCKVAGVELNNTMWPLDNTSPRQHRSRFYHWVRNLTLMGGTPTRSAYVRAGEYLRKTGLSSPWSHLPGTTQAPELACRRAYQVLFTDGQWTGSPGAHTSWDYTENQPVASYRIEADSVDWVLPDGKSYSQQRPYKGPASNGSDSLADLAFKYWATDLQPGTSFPNEVRPQMPVPSPQVYGKVTVDPYWNPANNPATWQHLVTYAIGFGAAAAITNPTWAGSTFAGTDFAKLVDGSTEWPGINTDAGRYPDLWHAAVNSRGRLFAATDQKGLDEAFRTILGEIVSQNSTAGGAASSYRVLLSFT